MPDGPNFEEVFKKMQCLHGGNAEDVKIMVRYLRFFRDQNGYDMYLAHYLPMLPKDVAAEFVEKKELPQASEVITVTETVEVKEETPVVTETVETVVPVRKKRSK